MAVSANDKTANDKTAKAIWGTLISPNESDRNFEPANVVDGLFAIARSLAAAIEDQRPAFIPAPTGIVATFTDSGEEAPVIWMGLAQE